MIESQKTKKIQHEILILIKSLRIKLYTNFPSLLLIYKWLSNKRKINK